MTMTLILRRGLLARLLLLSGRQFELGGQIGFLLNLDGELAVVQTVIPVDVHDVIKGVELSGNVEVSGGVGNLQLLNADGSILIPKFVLDGCAALNSGVGVEGGIEFICDLTGKLNAADMVKSADSADKVVKIALNGNANTGKILFGDGADQVISVSMDGYAMAGEAVSIESYIGFILGAIGKIGVAELTKQGEATFSIYIPTMAEIASNKAAGVEGKTKISTNTDALLVVAHTYTTERNEARGTTYYITSEFYTEVDNTIFIGGFYGS